MLVTYYCFFFLITYHYFHFSSRQIVFNAIKRLTQRAENFVRDKKAREDDKIWIERKLTEGNFGQVRDISLSSKPTPTKDSTPLSPKRTEPPIEVGDYGRGKRAKFHKSSCELDCCAPVRRALFIDDVLELVSNLGTEEEEEEPIPDDGDPDFIVVDDEESIPKQKSLPKTPRPTFANVIALQARFNTPDDQVALWWNMVSL